MIGETSMLFIGYVRNTILSQSPQIDKKDYTIYLPDYICKGAFAKYIWYLYLSWYTIEKIGRTNN